LKVNNKIKYLYVKGRSKLKSNDKKFTENLVSYCPNLIEYEGPLYVRYRKTRNNSLVKLFKNCSNLEKLYFWGESSSYDISDLLEYLSSLVPKNLNNLRLDPC